MLLDNVKIGSASILILSTIINRYRRGLETCPQAKTFKSGHAFFFSFFGRFRATSMTQRRVENNRVHFWTYSPVSVKSYFKNFARRCHESYFFFRSLLSYVQSYDRRANSHGDLLRERILEPCDWVYSSIDNLAKNCDEALSRAQSSPELDQEPPPKPPKKAPKKPMRKSKRRKDGKNGQFSIKFHIFQL